MVGNEFKYFTRHVLGSILGISKSHDGAQGRLKYLYESSRPPEWWTTVAKPLAGPFLKNNNNNNNITHEIYYRND